MSPVRPLPYPTRADAGVAHAAPLASRQHEFFTQESYGLSGDEYNDDKAGGASFDRALSLVGLMNLNGCNRWGIESKFF